MTADSNPRRLHRHRLVLGAALLGLLALLAPAASGQNNQCADGAKIRIAGTLGEVYANNAGGWSMIVRGMRSPCKFMVNMLAIEKRPPASCKTGASITASVLVDDFGDFLAVGKVSDLACQ